MAKLFVGNLEFSVTGDDLRECFSQAGTVVDSVVIMDKMTGRSRGFGFVEFGTDEEANEAISKLNDTELKGRKITVSIARPQEPRN